MSEEEIEALKEMQHNCLNASVYDDEKRLIKSNAITKALMQNEENEQLRETIKNDDLTINKLCNDNKQLQQQLSKEKEKNSKAIDYIYDNNLFHEEYNGMCNCYFTCDNEEKKDLLDILGGTDE